MDPMTRAGTLALSIEGFLRWLIRFLWQIVMLVHSWRALCGFSNPLRRALAKHPVKREGGRWWGAGSRSLSRGAGPLTDKPKCPPNLAVLEPLKMALLFVHKPHDRRLDDIKGGYGCAQDEPNQVNRSGATYYPAQGGHHPPALAG